MANLRQDGHELSEASGVEEAKRYLASNDFDVVFTDQKMPDGEGLEVIAAVGESDPTISVVMLTGVATIELANCSAMWTLRRGFGLIIRFARSEGS